MLAKTVTILNKKGLHARASAKFVKLAAEFDAEILVIKGENQVSGKSLMGLLTLAAAKDCSITIQAIGPDEDAAIAALRELIADKFGEE